MKKSTIKAIAAILCLAMVITTFSFMFFMPAAFGATKETVKSSTADMTDEQKEELMVRRLNILLAYLSYIDASYKDEVDLNLLLNGAFKGATDALEDQFSEYFQTLEEKEDFQNYVDGTYGGVGVVITTGKDYPTISSVTSGSPAEKAGLQKGDKFKNIAGTDMAGQTSSAASGKLRGDAGTTVEMTILRGNQELTFKITRAILSEQTVYTYTFEEYPGLTQIRISSFDSDTSKELFNALQRIEEQRKEPGAAAPKVILDLRNNGGGYINQAERATDFLVEGGYIDHYERQGEIFASYEANNGWEIDYPMVVLVNGDTASSAELMAAALQEHGIKLVGTTTYGKGYYQSMKNLADGHSFKISEGYFLTPSKKNFAGKGITPDYVVRNSALTEEEAKAARAEYENFVTFDGTSKPKSGDYNISVLAAQQRLNLLGYNVPETGRMDAQTVAAIKKFQTENGLYAYAVLDLSTQNAIDIEAIRYALGQSDTDHQKNKALELLGY